MIDDLFSVLFDGLAESVVEVISEVLCGVLELICDVSGDLFLSRKGAERDITEAIEMKRRGW